MTTREYGTIESAYLDDADGRCDTVWLSISFGGGAQGFGGYVLNQWRDEWIAELCALFGVSSLKDLVGKHCWALRSFSDWNENIEGVENTDGRRFTATAFFRKRQPEKTIGVLERRRESLVSCVASLARRMKIGRAHV